MGIHVGGGGGGFVTKCPARRRGIHSDDVRPPAAAGPAGPAAVVVGLAAPVELVPDEEASQTGPTPVVVAARVAAADKSAVGDPVPLDDGLSYLVHVKQIEERE